MITVALLMLLGSGIGLFSSFFGLGGGMIMIPVLYELFPGVSHVTIVACSLSTVFLNSLVNTYNFLRADMKPRWGLIVLAAVPLAIGVTIGLNILHDFSQSTAKLALAIVLIGVIIYQLLHRHASEDETTVKKISALRNVAVVTMALFGGMLAGISGLGGGFVLVPIFLTITNVPAKLVSPHTNVAIGIGAMAGCLSLAVQHQNIENPFVGTIFESFQLGHLNIGVPLCIFISASITSRFGVRLVKKTGPETTKKLFVTLISLMALRLLTTL